MKSGKMIRIKLEPDDIEKINIDPDKNEVQFYLKRDRTIKDTLGNEYKENPGQQPIVRKYFRAEDMHRIDEELYRVVNSKETNNTAASTRFMEVLDDLEINPS